MPCSGQRWPHLEVLGGLSQVTGLWVRARPGTRPPGLLTHLGQQPAQCHGSRPAHRLRATSCAANTPAGLDWVWPLLQADHQQPDQRPSPNRSRVCCLDVLGAMGVGGDGVGGPGAQPGVGDPHTLPSPGPPAHCLPAIPQPSRQPPGPRPLSSPQVLCTIGRPWAARTSCGRRGSQPTEHLSGLSRTAGLQASPSEGRLSAPHPPREGLMHPSTGWAGSCGG